MLAAVVEKPGQLVIKEVEKPKPGPQQFLIKTLAMQRIITFWKESLMATMTIIHRFWDMKCVGKW